MRIRFWGVRGSLPAPLLPSQIKSKISAILERITPEDIATPEDRERFLAGLPQWLFGTVGGNSPCVSVQLASTEELIIFDAGSGIRELGLALAREKSKYCKYHIFFSHFHMDHILGLPFFDAVYNPAAQLNFYSPVVILENALHGEMTYPYYPVPMDTMGSKKEFYTLTKPQKLMDSVISYRKMNHPGDSYAYKVDDGSHSFIYATDIELSEFDFEKNEENSSFFSNADIIVIDSQYTLEEAIEKYNWGHTAFSLALDFAATWSIKHIVFFHHDPTYDDQKLFSILQSATWYTDRMNIKDIKISLAMEGMEINL